VVYDNEALYKVCKNEKRLNIPCPKYDDLNLLIAQCFSTMTLSLRFACELACDLNNIQTTLCPYVRMKFMMTSFAPLYNTENFAQANSPDTPETLVESLLGDGKEDTSLLCNVDLTGEREKYDQSNYKRCSFFGMMLFFRGRDIQAADRDAAAA